MQKTHFGEVKRIHNNQQIIPDASVVVWSPLGALIKVQWPPEFPIVARMMFLVDKKSNFLAPQVEVALRSTLVVVSYPTVVSCCTGEPSCLSV